MYNCKIFFVIFKVYIDYLTRFSLHETIRQRMFIIGLIVVMLLCKNVNERELAKASTMFRIVLVSPQLPVPPLVFRCELDLSGDSVIWQRTLGVMSLPLTIVRCVVVMTHPHWRHSCARQIVVFWIELRAAIAQVPETYRAQLHRQTDFYTKNHKCKTHRQQYL